LSKGLWFLQLHACCVCESTLMQSGAAGHAGTVCGGHDEREGSPVSAT